MFKEITGITLEIWTELSTNQVPGPTLNHIKDEMKLHIIETPTKTLDKISKLKYAPLEISSKCLGLGVPASFIWFHSLLPLIISKLWYGFESLGKIENLFSA